MNSCKYIKERIDEAEKPDLLSFEVTEHIGQCDECERFAIERTALRKLVASGTRVSAPTTFDAVLKARLAEVKSRRSFWWLGSPSYLRIGAATAALIVIFVAAQYGGLFSDNVKRTTATVADTPMPAPGPDLTSSAPTAVSPLHKTERDVMYSGQALSRTRRGDVAVSRTAPTGYMTSEDDGVVLVRGRRGDIDVQMPTVSVGAQPLLYVTAGQRTVRNAGTSF